MMVTGNMKLWKHFYFYMFRSYVMTFASENIASVVYSIAFFFSSSQLALISSSTTVTTEEKSMFCLILNLIYFMIFKDFFFKMAIILKLPQVNYLDSQRNLFVLDIGFVVRIICSQF